MKIKFVHAIPAVVLFAGSVSAQTLQYPVARKSDQVDVYFGTRVVDPYRWLEDTDSPETRAWIQAENAVTQSYLATIPERQAIHAKLEEVWNYPKFGSAFKAGGKYFYYANTGLQNQDVLYVQDNRDGKPRVLIDPNTLSANGTVALSDVEPSRNGRYIAYSISRSGSDWQEFKVRDVETGKDLSDDLNWVKFSGAGWTHDDRGFFYSRYDAQDSGNVLRNVVRSPKVYYHRINTAQSQDEFIYDRADQPDWLFDTHVSDDGMYAIITVSQGTDVKNRLYFIDLDNPGHPHITAPVVKLIDRSDAEYAFIGNNMTMFYIRTDLQAPNSRVVAIDIDFPRVDRWTTIVAETKDAMAEAHSAGGKLAAIYLQDAKSLIRVYDLPPKRVPGRRSAGGEYQSANVPRGGGGGVAGMRDRGGSPNSYDIQLPDMGTVGSVSSDTDDDELLFSFESFLRPKTLFIANVDKRKLDTFRETKLAVDVSKFETREVFYTSKDGTRIPMFITCRKDLVQNGQNPTLLYGYGGFNISETPNFRTARLVWLEMGGVYALANIRGGAEYGKAWHETGMLAKKQNVFDDFIAGAEYLIRERYTSTPKLAINGGSNGGLLVGAVLNQRPDLFGAAIPQVGVMDMLRFQKFTIGWAWVSDYGSSEDSTQFKTLFAYSPLHNIKPGTKYPATLIMTSDHDDRVVPGHSFKYAATLQPAQAGPAPILIRIQTEAGHGAGKPTSKQIDEAADQYAFLVKNLQMKFTFQ